MNEINQKEELKPCPFCGSEAKEYNTESPGDGGPTYWIHCSSRSSDICGVMPYTRYWDCEDRSEAIKSWNTRPAVGKETGLLPLDENTLCEFLKKEQMKVYEDRGVFLLEHEIAKLICARFGKLELDIVWPKYRSVYENSQWDNNWNAALQACKDAVKKALGKE
jgi:hypothetical protein